MLCSIKVTTLEAIVQSAGLGFGRQLRGKLKLGGVMVGNLHQLGKHSKSNRRVSCDCDCKIHMQGQKLGLHT